MAATTASGGSPRSQRPHTTYAAPQTRNANNTSVRTSVTTMSRCFQAGFQRFLLLFVAPSRPRSTEADITGDLRSTTLLFDKSDRSFSLASPLQWRERPNAVSIYIVSYSRLIMIAVSLEYTELNAREVYLKQRKV